MGPNPINSVYDNVGDRGGESMGEICRHGFPTAVVACTHCAMVDARLAVLREVREMVDKRIKRNISRAKAMKEQFPGSELYGETEQTYLAFAREDSEIWANVSSMIVQEEKP